MPEQRIQLSGVALNVLDPEKLAAFYTGVLGMHRCDGDGQVRAGFGGEGAYLELRQSVSKEPYAHNGNDEYWKIGITLPNVDLAHKYLTDRGVSVSLPSQFQDIGYMCHLTDPEGFQIELLQHTFAGRPRTSEGDPNIPLGGGAQIGQITLRSTDIEKDLFLYQEMGMKLLSIQPIEGRDFELYFLAFTQQDPPHPDLKAVENRAWLWQRPYTTLELQCLTAPGAVVEKASNGSTGYSNICFDE